MVVYISLMLINSDGRDDSDPGWIITERRLRYHRIDLRDEVGNKMMLV